MHEFVGDVDAVMQVEALAVEIAGGLADFQELLDLRMGDVEIDRRRAAPQRALAIARVRPSITWMKGMMPLVWPVFTFSPMERTLPQ